MQRRSDAAQHQSRPAHRSRNVRRTLLCMLQCLSGVLQLRPRCSLITLDLLSFHLTHFPCTNSRGRNDAQGDDELEAGEPASLSCPWALCLDCSLSDIAKSPSPTLAAPFLPDRKPCELFVCDSFLPARVQYCPQRFRKSLILPRWYQLALSGVPS